MSNLQVLLIQNRNKVEAEKKDHTQTPEEQMLTAAVAKNVEAYGFCFSKELIDVLSTYSREDLTSFYQGIVPSLKEVSGADRTYEPMYPNFPRQVFEADDWELFLNAVIHYWSFGKLLPAYEKDPRFPLLEAPGEIVLGVGTGKDYEEILKNFLCAGTSLSEQKKEDILAIHREKGIPFPTEIPMKENAMWAASTLWEEAADPELVAPYCRTATDILRFAVCRCHGDISLKAKTKFTSFPRAERRMMLLFLDRIPHPEEDMFRYRMEWIRLGEALHPGEYKNRYRNAWRAFSTLRNEKKPLFFAGQVQEAILAKDTEETVRLLSARPGEFARRLDKVLRDAENPYMVLPAFEKEASQVSAPVLFQVREHFAHRDDPEKNGIRTYIPKGNTANIRMIDTKLPPMEAGVKEDVQLMCEQALREKFAEKPAMGKVYLEESMKRYAIPSSERSASASKKRTITRGSRLPLSEKTGTIRCGIWWTNTDNSLSEYSRVDLDLSASFYDQNWKMVTYISYTDLRDNSIHACHSGDITDGRERDGKGVAEFIDFDRKAAEDAGIRYAAFQVYAYTTMPFSELPHASFGWMEREDAEFGEIFEPSTAASLIDLASNGRIAIPVILDLEKNEAIWCDLATQKDLEDSSCGGNNLESNLKGVTVSCYAMTHLERASLYDLVRLNAEARGELVDRMEEADVIFTDQILNPAPVRTEMGADEKEIQKEIPVITPFQLDYFYELLSDLPQTDKAEEHAGK